MAKPIPITQVKNLGRLFVKIPQNRDKARSNLRPIHALDTETWQGDIFLIADSDGDFVDTFKEGITIDTVLKFLTRKNLETSWNFFYNLSYDASVILKLLGKILNNYKRNRKLRFKYKDYTITYYPKKVLKIQKNHHSWNFFDIAQFYNYKKLHQAYLDNIGNLPENYLKYKSKRAQFSPNYYKDNRNKIRDYCINDCKLTKELSGHWIKLFNDAFGFYPSRWISAGYLAEKVLINNEIDIPKFNQFPYKLQEFAYCASFGGRFEILVRGFIGTAYLYDINSAYPFAFANIPDITKGKWIKRKTIHPKALLGFFKIETNIPETKYIPPFGFRRNNQSKTLVFPTASFVTYCTLDELKACENPKWYKILDSWQYLDENPTFPYKKFIQKLYNKRLELKQQNNPLQSPFKIILNAMYGKTGHKNGRKIGNLFNPIIFATITGKTRAQLYQFCIDNKLEREVISFATDSICTTKKLNLNSKRLGDFSLDKQGKDVYYLQNGIYRFNDYWKNRGLGNLGHREIEHLDTYVKGDKLYRKFTINRVKQLRSSIIQNEISEIGKIKPVIREVDLNADNKRYWLGQLTKIDNSKNNSMPLPANHFQL